MNAGHGGRQDRQPGRDSAPSGAEFAGIGIQFALTILVFVFAGVWLDRRLGSSPWFVLIGVIVGASGGFFSMYRQVISAQRRDAERMADRRRKGQ